MKVAILGCGPSGLAAAQAANDAGIPASRISVFSRPNKSELHGAQYLHFPLPSLRHVPSEQISVSFIGTMEGYRNKVYGETYRGVVSPEEFQGDHRAYDLRFTYDILWNLWNSRIQEYSVNPVDLEEHYPGLIEEFDLVVNTVPRKALCRNPEHEFISKTVYASGDAPGRGFKCPISCAPGTIVYNGSSDWGWYRTANIFGHTTAEWPASSDKPKPPIEGVVSIDKPLSTSCDCWPGMLHAGRYGAWRKGILVHQVYEEVVHSVYAHKKYGDQIELF